MNRKHFCCPDMTDENMEIYLPQESTYHEQGSSNDDPIRSLLEVVRPVIAVLGGQGSQQGSYGSGGQASQQGSQQGSYGSSSQGARRPGSQQGSPELGGQGSQHGNYGSSSQGSQQGSQGSRRPGPQQGSYGSSGQGSQQGSHGSRRPGSQQGSHELGSPGSPQGSYGSGDQGSQQGSHELGSPGSPQGSYGSGSQGSQQGSYGSGSQGSRRPGSQQGSRVGQGSQQGSYGSSVQASQQGSQGSRVPGSQQGSHGSGEVPSDFTTRSPVRLVSGSSRIPTRQPARSTTPKPNSSTRPASIVGHWEEDDTNSQMPDGCGQRFNEGFQVIDERKPEAFVIGGTAAEQFSWPWMVAIFMWRPGQAGRFVCGGSLVTTRHILTAAHCFDTASKNSLSYTVVLGSHNITSDASEAFPSGHLNVYRVFLHPQYVEKVHYHDLAVVLLATELKFDNRISSVCLSFAQDNIQPHTNVTITGWGHTSYGGKTSNILQEASLRIVPMNRCQTSYQDMRSQSLSHGITTNMICAADPKGYGDACQGDSGGPLVLESRGRWFQIGVVSFGYRCGEKDYPGVYTKVSPYMTWINRVLSSKL